MWIQLCGMNCGDQSGGYLENDFDCHIKTASDRIATLYDSLSDLQELQPTSIKKKVDNCGKYKLLHLFFAIIYNFSDDYNTCTTKVQGYTIINQHL